MRPRGRFQRLEKPRSTAPTTSGAVVRPERFAPTPEAPVQPGPAPLPSGVSAGRFEGLGASGANGPQDASGGPRLRPEDDGQPFVRCCFCRIDNEIDRATCRGCAADLSTAQQRAFNQLLWERLRAEREELRAETERLEANRRRAEVELQGVFAALRTRAGRPGEHPGRRAGRILGRWLSRRWPRPWVRRGVVASVTLLWAALLVALWPFAPVGLGLTVLVLYVFVEVLAERGYDEP
jgi:hypothetical protein